MRQHSKTTLALLMIVFEFFLSCTKNIEQMSVPELFINSEDVDNSIYRYAFARAHSSVMTKSGENGVLSIAPILNNKQDTVMFLINYNHGWEIIAADKRLPTTLFESEFGHFAFEKDDPLTMWLDIVSDDMTRIMSVSNEHLAFTQEEIDYNMSLWDAIDVPIDTFVIDASEGMYVLYSMETEDIAYDERTHILPTRWHTGSPYNSRLPMSTIFSSEHVFASSGTVATAQMLYFLHATIGAPHEMVGEAFYLDDSTLVSNSWSSDVWDQMGVPEDTSGNVATMMAYIANNICTRTIAENSMLDPSNPAGTIQSFLSRHGVTSSLCDYDDNMTILKNSLLAGIPVLVSASEARHSGIYYTFIIDGYVRTRQRTTYVYKWVTKQTLGGDYIFDDSTHPDIINSFDGSPSILRIYINWGLARQWRTPGLSNRMYTLTSDWILPSGFDSSHIDLRYQREMLYGFNATND